MLFNAAVKKGEDDDHDQDHDNEAPGGQEVFHLHFHVIPRYSGERMGPPGQMVKDMSVLADQAKKISKLLDQ